MLQEVPRSGWATKGSRRRLQQRSVQILNYLATILQRLINADTLQTLPRKSSIWTLGQGTIHFTTIPNVANSKVSVTKSLMSRIVYAALVTSNIFRWDAHHGHLTERSLYIVWSCSAQSCLYSRFTLFVPSGRARAIIQGGGEQIKIYYVRSCSAQSCSDSFIWAFRALWEN